MTPPETTGRMKYLLQIRFNGADAAIGRLPADEQRKLVAEFEAIRQLPGVLDANQLQPFDTATTVRVKDGQTTLAAQPPVDPRAALDGYYLYNATDLDDAIQFAARIPATRMGATVEIRPVHQRP
jgi:hypothetical protein